MHEKSVETYEHAWKSMKSGLLEDWHKQVWVEADTNDWIRGGRSEASTHSKSILHFIAPLCQVATCHQLPWGIRCPLRRLCRCIREAQGILRASRDPANMQNHQENAWKIRGNLWTCVKVHEKRVVGGLTQTSLSWGRRKWLDQRWQVWSFYTFKRHPSLHRIGERCFSVPKNIRKCLRVGARKSQRIPLVSRWKKKYGVL